MSASNPSFAVEKKNPFVQQFSLVTVATALGAIGLGYYAYQYFKPSYGPLPVFGGVVGGAVVGGYVAGSLTGAVLR